MQCPALDWLLHWRGRNALEDISVSADESAYGWQIRKKYCNTVRFMKLRVILWLWKRMSVGLESRDQSVRIKGHGVLNLLSNTSEKLCACVQNR